MPPTWLLLLALPVALGLVVASLEFRRRELREQSATTRERALAQESRTHRARLQHPVIDGRNCIGCGACVRACPEEQVLGILHGQATVLHGARCVGHGLCADVCPTGAVVVEIADLQTRRDLPVVDEHLEVPGRRGVFLAGELTGFALVRRAILHGTSVAEEVARRERPVADVLDLLVVGAGPAGLASALRATELGLRVAVVEQEDLGGTVSKYPRGKLVLTQPVTLPVVGALDRDSYAKEELLEIWQDAVRRSDLDLRTRVHWTGLAEADEGWTVETSEGPIRAANVCLALGRRGTPRKLDVPGEELPHVLYHLIDAAAIWDRSVVIVGGGDSAVEAAIALSEGRRNRVALSYRKSDFSRIKPRNRSRLEDARREGTLELLTCTEVMRIERDRVLLRSNEFEDAPLLARDADAVFVMIGGTPPTAALEAVGVSFDPADRPLPDAAPTRGLSVALTCVLVLAGIAAGWSAVSADYYGVPLDRRIDHPAHELLRPGSGIGLFAGVAAALLVLANLAYLVRRSTRLPLRFGTLRSWMTVHVATGLLALVAVLVHGGLRLADTTGGHAATAMLLLVLTGVVGRTLYAFVPRAANGRELEVEEAKRQLDVQLSGLGDDAGPLEKVAFEEVDRLLVEARPHRGVRGRLRALWSVRRTWKRGEQRIREAASRSELGAVKQSELLQQVRRAHRAALGAAVLEDLRAVLASWRWFHRWVGLLLALLVARHVVDAIRYGGIGS